MGTLDKIRQTSPYALAIFAILFIGFMVASDADISNLMRQGSDYKTQVLATINDDDLLRKDYDDRVTERIEQQQKQSQEKDFQPDIVQVRKEVWGQMVDEILLRQEADRAGITITDEELLDILIDNPPDYLRRNFTDSTGNFNKAFYVEILTNPDKIGDYLGNAPAEEKLKTINSFKKDIVLIQNYLRKQKLMENFMAVVNTSSSIVSDNFAKERFTAENSTANVEFVAFLTNKQTENQVTVTDKELRDYYEKYKQTFKQKEQRKIKYIKIPIIASKSDTDRAVKRIQRIESEMKLAQTVQEKDSIFDVKMSEYGGQTNDFALVKDIDQSKMTYLDSMKALDIFGPINISGKEYFFRLDSRRTGENEVVKASHILIKFDNNKDSAKSKALELLNKAKKGEDFAALATANSQDPGSAQKGGDLGYFGKGQMVKPFEEAAFAANIGEIVGPVESDYGYHIIKVTDKKSEEIKYSEIIIEPTISTSTKNMLYRQAYSFQKQVTEGAAFDTIARRLSYVPIESQFFTIEQPIINSQYITDMSFSEPMGTVFEPLDMAKENEIIVAQVIDEKPAGYVSYQDIKEEIKKRVTHIKHLDLLKRDAEALYNKIKETKSFDYLRQIDTTIQIRSVEDMKMTGNIPGIGSDPGLSGSAFTQPIGKISKPIRGTRGYYILLVKDRKLPEPSVLKAELPKFKSSLQQTITRIQPYQGVSAIFNKWFTKIKEDSKIEDNRRKYYKEY